jgi:isoleucyl-tRNA synthetase
VLTHDPVATRAVREHADLIANELNVESVSAQSDEAGLVEMAAKADFKRLGKRLGSKMKEVAAEVASLGPEDVAAIMSGGSVTIAGEALSADDIIVTRTARPGTVVETDGPLAVSLDIELDDRLRSEGTAREVVSRIQQLRREHDLAVTDRIHVMWSSEDDHVRAAIEQNASGIADEVLAVALERAESLSVQDGAEVVSVEHADLLVRLTPA